MILRDTQISRPVLPPRTGVHELSLAGPWLVCRGARDKAPGPDADWQTRTIPWDASATGSREAYDWEKGRGGQAAEDAGVWYWKRRVELPPECQGKRLFLRFEGAAHRAEVWWNGTPIGEHTGSFTPWELELAAQSTPGAELLVRTTDDTRLGERNRGGLIRPVRLIAREAAHLTRLHADGQADGTLRVWVCANAPGTISLTLRAPDRADIELESMTLESEAERLCTYRIPDALTWDAEHPRLYTLTADFRAEGSAPARAERRIGFRSVRVDGGRLLVNGSPVKLRGIARNDCDPYQGKAVGYARIERELQLYKEANINFIRTVGAPPPEALLELCDEMGFYVQDDAALHGIDQPPQPPTQHDPAFARDYLTAVAEMAERDRSHPSVIIWSVGSRSCWGVNFRRCMDYIRESDDTRPVTFSYPMTAEGERRQSDLWPVQYAAWNLDLGKPYDHMLIGHTFGVDEPPGYALGSAPDTARPVLHEQIAPVPCVNREEHRRDPAVRDFWGQTILRLWPRILEAPNALGCAIEGGTDQVTVFAGGESHEEGGLLDCWLRPKPEYHYVKTAYSPVKVSEWKPDGVMLRNEYFHTNLRELTIRWYAGERSGSTAGCDTPPGETGSITLPEGVTEIALVDGQGIEINRFARPGLTQAEPESAAPAAPPVIVREDGTLIIRGARYEAVFSEATGLLCSLSSEGEPLLTSGPYMNTTGLRLPDWIPEGLQAHGEGLTAVVEARGRYGDVLGVTFRIRFDERGSMETRYRIDSVNAYCPREVKIRIGLDPGGLDELGLYYLANGALDTLRWTRKPDPLMGGVVYPPDHIGRWQGSAARTAADEQDYGQEPSAPWSGDSLHWALFGRYDTPAKGTNDFRSTKTDILSAELTGSGGAGLRVLGSGAEAVRIEAVPNRLSPRDPSIVYSGAWWDAPDTTGASFGTELLSDESGARAELRFTGTGAVCYGPGDMIGGIARIYVDGEPRDEISQAFDTLEQAGFSRGHEKRYNRILYSVDGLPHGEHRLTIEVTGRKEARADYAYVMIDSFEILNGHPTPVKLMVNSAVNYTRLAWGNYVREAIWLAPGDTGCTAMRILPKGGNRSHE